MSLDDSYTKALLHMDGADASTTFIDESGKSWTANGNAQIDTAQSKFGGASGLFDGTGDYLNTANSADFDFGTGDWTVDFWIRRNGTKALPHVISGRGAASTGWAIGLGDSDNKIRVVYLAAVKILTVGTVADLTWTHIAVVRYGNTVSAYLNGVADANTDDCTGDSINTEGTGVVIGRALVDTNDYYWNGWIDEIRVSKGIARWTANFTPPTGEYHKLGGSPMWWF